MSTYLHTLTSIFILALLILLVVGLRKYGLLKEEHGAIFSKLVTHVTLPALIFDALAKSTFKWEYMLLFLYIFLVELFILVSAWGIGTFMKLPATQMGSFLLTSAFGSSSLLGYALITELYPHNIAALAEGTLISELGVGLPLFTLGVLIMIYYGKEKKYQYKSFENALQFFKSPIFISLIFGILWSFSSWGDKGLFITPLFEATYIIAKSNTFLVALTVGVLLRFDKLHKLTTIALMTILLKLILSPLLIYLPATMLSLHTWELQVLLLETSMPSAMLSVVLAKQYGCDAQLAAKLVFFTLSISLLTISIMINI